MELTGQGRRGAAVLAAGDTVGAAPACALPEARRHGMRRVRRGRRGGAGTNHCDFRGANACFLGNVGRALNRCLIVDRSLDWAGRRRRRMCRSRAVADWQRCSTAGCAGGPAVVFCARAAFPLFFLAPDADCSLVSD
jgi:hypothetical protein